MIDPLFFRWMRQRRIHKLQDRITRLQAEINANRRGGYLVPTIEGDLAVAQARLKRLQEKA